MDNTQKLDFTDNNDNIVVIDRKNHLMMSKEQHDELLAMDKRIKEIECVRENFSSRIKADMLGCYTQEELDKLRAKREEFVLHHTIDTYNKCMLS